MLILNRFWEEKCDNSPETRVELARLSRLQREAANKSRENAQEGRRHNKDGGGDATVNFFWPDGRPRNINRARLEFTLEEDEEKNALLLDVAVYRFLDTSLLDVDVQPTYVRVVVKNKILQLVLPEEVHPDKSTAARSQTTGHLVVTMPMVNGNPRKKTQLKSHATTNPVIKPAVPPASKRELLEIGPADPSMDFSRICEMAKASAASANGSLGTHSAKGRKPYTRPVEKEPSQEFREDPQVPPLE